MLLLAWARVFGILRRNLVSSDAYRHCAVEMGRRQAAAMAAIAGGRENDDLELMRKEEEARLPYLDPQLNPNYSAISQVISTIQGARAIVFCSSPYLLDLLLFLGSQVW